MYSTSCCPSLRRRRLRLQRNMGTNILWFYFALLVILATTIRAFFKKKYQYWKRNGFPYLEPDIPFGTMKNPFNEKLSIQERLQEHYMTCKKKGYKYVGIYIITSPQLVIIDPDLIKSVLSKDFSHFMERGVYHNENDPLSMHLFSLGTSKWKKLRPKITPTFTSGKMKMMFNMVVTCGRQLATSMEEICAKGPVDIKHTLACYTIDVIGSCAFGIDCNSFTDPFSDFSKYSKKIFEVSRIKIIRELILNIYPDLGKTLRLKLMPRDLTEFFLNIVRHSVKYRQENGIVRNDFLQLLMELVDNNKDTDSISFSEMVAQVYIFFLAGFETSSATITFCLLELCLNHDVQEQLREEVNLTLNKHNGTVTYESLMEMKYMDAVINETLRKYPPLPLLRRRCIQDYHVPNSNVTIRKGIKIIIPLIGLHNDPEYFPNPEKFDPNRFSVENKHLITPFTYMPFGDGPRACIGIRFGIMQTKIGLVTLLRDYKFCLSEKMEIPIKFKLHSVTAAVEGGVWLNATKI